MGRATGWCRSPGIRRSELRRAAERFSALDQLWLPIRLSRSDAGGAIPLFRYSPSTTGHCAPLACCRLFQRHRSNATVTPPSPASAHPPRAALGRTCQYQHLVQEPDSCTATREHYSITSLAVASRVVLFQACSCSAVRYDECLHSQFGHEG